MKWFKIYVAAAFRDGGGVPHEAMYNRTLAILKKHPNWRGMFFIKLDAWYKAHPPSKKRRSRGQSSGVVVVETDDFNIIDDFVDPLADIHQADAMAALRQAAAEASAAAGR